MREQKLATIPINVVLEWGVLRMKTISLVFIVNFVIQVIRECFSTFPLLLRGSNFCAKCNLLLLGNVSNSIMPDLRVLCSLLAIMHLVKNIFQPKLLIEGYYIFVAKNLHV